MLLRMAIIVLLVALITSLFSGLFFLMKDTNNSGRLVNALTVRISLTVLLIALVAFGFWSGEFVWNTPWLR